MRNMQFALNEREKKPVPFVQNKRKQTNNPVNWREKMAFVDRLELSQTEGNSQQGDKNDETKQIVRV